MKIAVVGSGISGLGSAYLLGQQHEVHLFESADRLGGHAHTVTVTEGQNFVPVDTGFLVYNELTYPHLIAMFKKLGVETIASDMSLSVQVKEKDLEWSGTDLNSVFGQRKNLLNFRFYRMLSEILRFHREADANLKLSRQNHWSLRDLLKQRNYTAEFCHDYMIPIGAAIWSTPEKKMLDFPAESFLTFFLNHRLLQVNDRPVWRTVKGGSVEYVTKISRHIPHIHLGEAVLEVERINGKVVLRTFNDSFEFDRVVMATHAPITQKILKNKTPLESEVLSSIGTELNRAILHCDDREMPKNKRCWSSWNVVGSTNHENERKVSLSYHINRLQSLPTSNNYFVTLNSSQELNSVIREIDYQHPIFDQRAIQAQKLIPEIQGIGGVFYAGAWTRYGFHEDGLLSAVKVAEKMGIGTPWGVS